MTQVNLLTPLAGQPKYIQATVKASIAALGLVFWIIALGGISAAQDSCYEEDLCVALQGLGWFMLWLELLAMVGVTVVAFMNMLYTIWSLLLFLSLFLVLTMTGILVSYGTVETSKLGGYDYSLYDQDAINAYAAGAIMLTIFNFVMVGVLAIDGGRVQQNILAPKTLVLVEDEDKNVHISQDQNGAQPPSHTQAQQRKQSKTSQAELSYLQQQYLPPNMKLETSPQPIYIQHHHHYYDKNDGHVPPTPTPTSVPMATQSMQKAPNQAQTFQSDTQTTEVQDEAMHVNASRTTTSTQED